MRNGSSLLVIPAKAGPARSAQMAPKEQTKRVVQVYPAREKETGFQLSLE
jgi:hypothetical protein